MKKQEVINHIVDWLKEYSDKSHTNGFVVGISGGIDSALTSTLCALTGKPTLCLNMPILQHHSEYNRGVEHIHWLKEKFKNVTTQEVELTNVFKKMEETLPSEIQDWLTMANTRSRLRMTTLYAFAGHHKMLVAGTGNKVEDFGIGFFTKYGDGGVDISPIADLLKPEVFALAEYLGVVHSILAAAPTDGLFADGRSDEDSPKTPEIGTLLRIDTPRSISLCMVSALSSPMPSHLPDEPETRIIEVEFLGELPKDDQGRPMNFRRGSF